MGGRKRAIRKLKRELRRKNAGKSTNTNNTNNTSKQHEKPTNYQNIPAGSMDMRSLMHLLSMMGGRGNSVGGTDPNSFMNIREADARNKKEIAREKLAEKMKIREMKIEEQKLKNEEQKLKTEGEIARMQKMNEGLKIKQDAEIAKQQTMNEALKIKQDAEHKIAQNEMQQAQMDVQHRKRMLDVQLQKSGVEGVMQQLHQRVRDAEERIALNEQHGSLAAELRKQSEIKRTLDKLMDAVGYKIKTTPELAKLYNSVTNKLQSYLDKFNEFHEGLMQLGELRDNDKVTQDLINDRAAVDAELDELIRHLQFEKKSFEDAAKANEDRLNEITEKKYKTRNMQQELATARARYEDSQYTYDFDENGDLIHVYDESEKLPVIKPEDDEQVRALKKERDKILKHIQQADPSMNLEQWATKLKLIRQHTQQGVDTPKWITEQINRYNEILSKKKRIQSPTSKKIYHNDILTFASRFGQIENDYIRASMDAKKSYDDAVAHNKRVEDSWHPKKVKVTDELVEKINKEYMDVREQIDEKNKQTEQNKDRNRRIKEIARETAELNRQLANKPDPGEEARIYDELMRAENEKRKLERELTTRQIREQEHDKMRQDTQRINVQNELTAKQLDEYNTSMDDRDKREKAAIEARVMADKQRELNEKRMQTHKSEQDKRMAEHELNAQQSDRIRAMDEQIVREHVKSEQNRIEKEQIEQLRRAQNQAREHRLASEAMKMVDVCTRGANGFENLTAQLHAVQDRLNTVANEQMADNTYVKKKQDEIISRLDKDPMLHLRVVKHHERNGSRMFQTEDELRAALNTRERVDDYDRYLTGLSTPRPGTPPPMKPGYIHRFYSVPQDSSTFDMHFDDESDEE